MTSLCVKSRKGKTYLSQLADYKDLAVSDIKEHIRKIWDGRMVTERYLFTHYTRASLLDPLLHGHGSE